jgi:sugar-phosphatase
MIKAIIFDMDGLIIDSEPLWKEAEKAAFKEVGINLTTEMCSQTTGLDTNDVIKHWFNYQPWDSMSFGDMKNLIENNLIELVRKDGKAMPGVHAVVEFAGKMNLPLAVASSSITDIIHEVLKQLEIFNAFDVIHSSEHEKFGKPNPAVYLSTAEKLNVPATECLAFEDSFYGLLAAKSARCKAVIVPEKSEFEKPKYGFADLKLKSLIEFSEDHFKRLSDL